MTNKDNFETIEDLGRRQIWGLYRMVPSFGNFAIEISDGERTETLEFSKNTDAEFGEKQLFSLLGKFPETYRKVEAEFEYGFGFILRVRVTVND